MPETFLTFQKFNDPGLAAAVAAQLEADGIDCILEKEAPVFDATFAGNDFEPTTHLKVAPTNFTRAHTALEAFYQAQLPSMDPDYYLFSFSDAELMEIVQRPDEWGHLDYVLAKKLLAEKGHLVTPALAEELKQQRMTELARPESTHPRQIFVGYVVAFAGGFFGLILGYILGYLTKTLPNGQRVYVYPPAERRHGKRMLVISAISFPFWLWMSLGGKSVIPWLGPF